MPIDAAALPGMIHTVLWATFALATVFGFIASRTHFCTMGAVADLVNFGDASRMRQWLLAIGVAAEQQRLPGPWQPVLPLYPTSPVELP